MMSTSAFILKCFNKKPDDIDLASVDFPGISSERLASTVSDIWTLHRASLLKVEDEKVLFAGIHIGNVSEFDEIATDPAYVSMKEKVSEAAERSNADPDDFDLLQDYVDSKENCAFLVVNALEIAYLQAGLEEMSESLRQFKIGYMTVMQRFPEDFYGELMEFFFQENVRLRDVLDDSRYAEILLEQVELFVENHQYTYSADLYEKLEALKESMTDASMGKFRYLEALYLFHLSQENAEVRFSEAMQYLSEVAPTWETRLINAHSLLYLGILATRKQLWEQALMHFHSAVEYLAIIPDDQYIYFMSEKSRIYHHLGYVYDGAGQYDEAENYYRRALDIREELGRYSYKIEGDYAITLGNLAFLYENTKRTASADQAFIMSIDVRKHLLPSSPREFLAHYARIMYSYLYVMRDRADGETADKYSSLMELCDEAIRIFRYFVQNDHGQEWSQKLAWLLFDRGISYYTAEEDYTKAEAYMKEALQLRESFIADDASWIEQASNICFRLGDMFFLKEEYQTAMEYFRKALNYRRQSSSEGLIINALNRTAECSSLLGEHSRALELYFEAMKMASALEDPVDRRVRMAFGKASVGEVYFSMNEYILSRIFYTQAIDLFSSLSAEYPDDEMFTDSISACRSWLDDIDSHLIPPRRKSSYLS